MRLLNCLPDGGFGLTSYDDDSIPPYAILSHTWTEGQEVTYNELLAGTDTKKDGYSKIRFCGERAAKDGLKYFWVDTCCIDKSRSDELSTAINSMFRWYERATKCYVYLSDVSVPDEVIDAQAFRKSWEQSFRRSRWFLRGWTLQELLAPPSVEFFSQNGRCLGTRVSLEQEICGISGIPSEALRDGKPSDFSVDERMKWAAKRNTTVKEDKIYCLFGIFSVFLPLIYGEGEEYATLRLRDEIQKRQQGQKKPDLQDLPISSPLLFPRNELFVGRESQMQAIERTLLSPNTHQRMTIYGLGGCGKSALALEFAYRALARYTRRLVFWVPAMSQESFDLAFREIGTRLHIPGVNDDDANVKQLVKQALSTSLSDDWLMIVDNADDPRILFESDSNAQSTRLIDYIPHSHTGSVLFTTRSRKAATELTQTYVLGLEDMNQIEARQLLARQTLRQALLTDEAAVDELLNLLTGLPLAIVQAAAFINENDISISEYVSLLQHTGTKAELFSERFEDPSRYQGMDSTVAKTWYISFEQIQRQDPLAAEYLSFISCIDRINIPQSLLPPGTSQLQHIKALGTLTGYAFLTKRQQTVPGSNQEKFFDMHRLVHMALRWWLEGHGQRKTWAGRAAARVKELVPYGGYGGREIWVAYLPHALHVVELKDALDSATLAELLARIGRCQESSGQYAAAELAHRQVWSLRKGLLGREHPDTLMSMSNLAWTLKRLGRYEEAELMHRQALEGSEKVLGRDHPDTLTSMSNLALALAWPGKYNESEVMCRQVLERKENVLGREHPETLASVVHLGSVLSRQEKYEEAELMHRRALEAYKKVLGREHPDTLASISLFGFMLEHQGKYKEAEVMCREVLEGRETILGQDHPDTLPSLHQLASVLESQQRYEEAEAMHRRALEGYEKVLGGEHPDTLTSISNLGSILERQRKYKEAEAMERQALEGREKVLGREHPDTLTSQRYKEAEAMNQRALEGYEKVLGREHPHTLASVSQLGSVLERQGMYKEAEAMHRRALEGYEKVLGREHPDTLTGVYYLAHHLAAQHRISESLLLYQRACAGYSATLGNNHPTTRACREHYSELCELEEQQNKLTFLPLSTRDTAMSTQKVARLSRGLARLGIRRKAS
ncbi:kinesin light chain 1 [Paraphaeosphaeria sporulosa]|uniref:Kinesin light chain 1 n=1 Tax=Paraphaeosphaeria sporulosa TaxID=1460663 RepID=A0A177CVZ5_9PLEO|nr:kinesin light chain 1 [Paraphaeosphaeria sporulosa]OAG11040.1 kinesin light chain 1 [Paraphaeosphaeria sporulosa]